MIRPRIKRIVATLIVTIAPSCAVLGQENAPSSGSRSSWLDPFFDDEDGKLDVSEYLANPGSFLLVPLPITEPAIGYGLGAGLVFLQPRKSAGAEGWKRPNISGIGGLKTENGTEAGGIFDMRYWGDGDFKSTAFALSSSVNMDFYSLGLNGDSVPRRYNLKADGAHLGGEWKIPLEHASLETNYSYIEIDAKLLNEKEPSFELPSRETTTISSVGFAFKYDSRDNLFSPQSGLFAKTSLTLNSEALGASDDFQRLSQVVIKYLPLGDRWVTGFKLDGQAIFGDYPFYAKPFVGLRGVPMMRFQGKYVVSGEFEAQYKIGERYRLVGFAGSGWSWDSFGDVDNNQSVVSGGAGVRYRLAQKFGMDVGIDIAVSEVDEVIYLQFGTAWLRL